MSELIIFNHIGGWLRSGHPLKSGITRLGYIIATELSLEVGSEKRSARQLVC